VNAVATLVVIVLCGLVAASMAGELCLLLSASHGLNVSDNCLDLHVFSNNWIGFRSGEGEPCYCFPYNDLCSEGGFGWTISSSPTDPFENRAAAPLGTGQLYLWYYCTNELRGLASAEFDLGGTMTVLNFTPMNGFINAGDATHLLLSAAGCPYGPVVAGAIQVSDLVPVESETWGRIKSTYR
jgi:hypothetical protein